MALLFGTITPIELYHAGSKHDGCGLCKLGATLTPPFSRAILKGNMEGDERHKLGAHYTSEIDIKKIVDPVIVQPWRQRLMPFYMNIQKTAGSKPPKPWKQLHIELTNYKVLDPACGSDNFYL